MGMTKKRLTFIRALELGEMSFTHKFRYIFKNEREMNRYIKENKDINIIKIEDVI